MLKINPKNINNNVTKLNNNINNYVENNINIFNELSKLSSYWNDKDFDNFNEIVLKEKEKLIEVQSQLEDIQRYYQKVYSYYNDTIDNSLTIYIRERKDTLIDNLNDCLNEIEKMSIKLNNIMVPRTFSKTFLLNDVKLDIKHNTNILKDYKIDIYKLITKIEKNELELNSDLNKIDTNIINKINIE